MSDDYQIQKHKPRNDELPSNRSSDSSSSLHEPIEPNEDQCGGKRNLIIGLIFIAVVIILGVVALVLSTRPSPIVYNSVQFDFQVFCPISYENKLVKKDNLFSQSLPLAFKPLLSDLKFNQTYVVTTRNIMTPNPNNDMKMDQQLQFCGLVRPWEGSCQNPEELRYVCSHPGPVFDLPTNEEIYVFWVNQIDNINVSVAYQGDYKHVNDCYQVDEIPDHPTVNYPQRCFIKAKTEKWNGCTYFDPTDLGYNDSAYKKVPIGYNNVPISPHIHGLEVRPEFDGGPLSWFSSKGRGIGYQSLEEKYFNIFTDQERKTIYSFYDCNETSVNLNAYPNTQIPGSLWYHDHAMATTGFNVMKGLYGMYTLRDKEIQKDLPKGQYQVLVLLHLNHNSRSVNKKKPFKRDAWYRFRFLNANYAERYSQISFYDTANQTMPLTIIGQDSALLKNLLPNITNFSVASAERFDLLVKFDSNQFKEGDLVKLRYIANSTVLCTIHLLMGEKQMDEQVLNYTPPTQLNVSFKNLTDSDIMVSKKRMRILLKKGGVYSVNAHTSFEQGKSENPQIGTVEDWYLINTNDDPHPFHVHLINFQIVKEYSLKMFKTTKGSECAYYQIDFFLKYANKTQCFPSEIKKLLDDKPNQHLYEKVCDYVQDNKTMTKSKQNQCFSKLANQQEFVNNISGINVEEQIGNSEFPYNVTKSDCSLSGYKYLCSNYSSQIPSYNRGWKQVSYIRSAHAMVLRIRWTKTDYDEKIDGTNYFHVPQKNLIEFPGFVYHCHFLPHEDREMMRPIMLQPSQEHKKELAWKDMYKKVNEGIGCGVKNHQDESLTRN